MHRAPPSSKSQREKDLSKKLKSNERQYSARLQLEKEYGKKEWKRVPENKRESLIKSRVSKNRQQMKEYKKEDKEEAASKAKHSEARHVASHRRGIKAQEEQEEEMNDWLQEVPEIQDWNQRAEFTSQQQRTHPRTIPNFFGMGHVENPRHPKDVEEFMGPPQLASNPQGKNEIYDQLNYLKNPRDYDVVGPHRGEPYELPPHRYNHPARLSHLKRVLKTGSFY